MNTSPIHSRDAKFECEVQPFIEPAAIYMRHIVRPLSVNHPGWDIIKRIFMSIAAPLVQLALIIPTAIGGSIFLYNKYSTSDQQKPI